MATMTAAECVKAQLQVEGTVPAWLKAYAQEVLGWMEEWPDMEAGLLLVKVIGLLADRTRAPGYFNDRREVMDWDRERSPHAIMCRWAESLTHEGVDRFVSMALTDVDRLHDFVEFAPEALIPGGYRAVDIDHRRWLVDDFRARRDDLEMVLLVLREAKGAQVADDAAARLDLRVYRSLRKVLARYPSDNDQVIGQVDPIYWWGSTHCDWTFYDPPEGHVCAAHRLEDATCRICRADLP